MTDGGYILPRVQNSHNGNAHHVSVIDMETSAVPDPHTAPQIVAQARRAFNTGKTKTYEFRASQLRKFRQFLLENSQAICDALYADLRKPEQESYIMEIDYLINQVNFTLDHLKEWMKPEEPEKSLINIFDRVKIYSDPYGVTLVMGAWNYPLNLTLSPVIGAIAAGNCCIIKPSDLSVHTSGLIHDLLPKYIDPECFPVFLGGIPETTDLLKERFDYIFYTGSTVVGKIIHKAATQYLTPCTLELGGKCPTYIDSTADIRLATKRILWGKFLNCGQTCVAPDYVLCNEQIQEEFLNYARELLEEFFGSNIKQCKDYGRIINERHFIRICNLLKNQKIAIGGQVDAQNLYIAPTILVDVKPEADVMNEEIFGPLLPIVNVKDAEAAIKLINAREKPLALYIFAKNEKIKNLFLQNTSSGGITINDTIVHLNVETLPFGGVGHSGMGHYHGKKSFDTFVHKKSVLLRTFNVINEKMQEMRYPPYTEKRTKILRMVMSALNRHVNFTKYLSYVMVFGLGVGVTVGGYYIKRHYEEK